MKFRTQYDKHERVYSNPGKKTRDVYAGKYDDSGVLDLVKKGVVNIYNEIQTHADSVDIHVILKRYANGDIQALNRGTVSFGDFSEMPSNFTDMLNLMIDKENEFKSLPVETKEKFNNSFEQYMATAGSPDWLLKMGFAEKIEQNPVQESAQVEETKVE